MPTNTGDFHYCNNMYVYICIYSALLLFLKKSSEYSTNKHIICAKQNKTKNKTILLYFRNNFLRVHQQTNMPTICAKQNKKQTIVSNARPTQ